MASPWAGILPAMTTKFTENDQLDLPLTKKNLEAQIAAGIDGIILGGTLGEASVLTHAERETLVKFSLDTIGGRIPVVMNIAEGSTREAVALAKDAERWGVQGLMLLPPMRYKSDHRETVAFFKAVADATPLPIMIYNNPIDYKTEVTIAMFEELIACSNITAVKESTRDVSNVTRLKNRFGDRLSVLCGVDTIAMEEMIMGAEGWVGGLVCAFPAETVAIYRHVKAGRIAEALAIHRWFLPLLELDLHPKLVQYIKLAEAQTGIGSEYVRAPRLVLEGEERERILSVIKTGIATRPKL
ncbi:MAG: dihydrodipicolinate synthase family protein [Bacteroidetes bacterium]|nr:dihydrodipicolinate synthase family protein [Bacteroidota bacterium]